MKRFLGRSFTVFLLFLFGVVEPESDFQREWAESDEDTYRLLSRAVERELKQQQSIRASKRETTECEVRASSRLSQDCVQERKDQVNQRKELYHFTESNDQGYEFPTPGLTKQEIVTELRKDAAIANWVALYNYMFWWNEDFRHTSEEKFKDYNSFDNYTKLYDMYMQLQKSIPGDDDGKYFRLIGEVNPYTDNIINTGKWRDDQIFTEQRLAGINPMVIQRVNHKNDGVGIYWFSLIKELNTAFDWGKAVKIASGDKKHLWQVVRDGELFVVRYPLYRDLINMDDVVDSKKDPRRTMWNSTSPIALFVSSQFTPAYKNNPTEKLSRNKLFPVAIQMDHKQDSPVYTPEDGGLWMLAKANLNVADVADVEIIQHLYRTHLFMDRVCIIAKRTLPDLHPLSQVLRFHCGAVLGTDILGLNNLLGEGKQIHQLFAIGWKGGVQLLNKAHKTYTWEDFDFYADLKKRGVDDYRKLPYYPFRDDGRLLKLGFDHFAEEYLKMYYRNNRDVQKDKELQAFANSMSAEGTGADGGLGELRGFPTPIRSVYTLRDVLSRLIWTASAQHAAVNYPASLYGAFVPNLPTKLYNDTRVEYDEFSPRRFVNSTGALRQGFLGMVLGTLRYDELFDYGSHLTDTRAGGLAAAYHTVFHTLIKKRIILHNVDRRKRQELTYTFLEPGWVPNSPST